MQRSVLIVFSLALCLTAGACRRSSTDGDSQAKPDPQGQRPSKSTETAELGGFVIAAPVRYQNLAIFPVLSKVPKNEDPYITLEEGLKAGTVQIFEVGADGARINVPDNDSPETSETVGGLMEQIEQFWPEASNPPASLPPAQDTQEATAEEDVREGAEQQETEQTADQQQVEEVLVEEVEVAGDVNRLMVLNTSGRPLYLMPGEVIYGGKQDRCIAEETIILASNKPQPIDVYCVEQGRWSGRSAGEMSQALATLLPSGRTIVASHDPEALDQMEEALKQMGAEANRGKFVASAGNLSKKSRMAVQEGKGQSEVWEEVAAANAAADVEVRSGTFTANYASAQVVDQLKPYIEKLREPVAGQKQVVGAIVAINGKVESVDVFGSTPLFKKLWPKLLKSYALDAANAADAPEAKKVCKLEAAEKFFGSAMQADVEKSEVEGGLVVTKRDSQGVVSFSASVAPAAAEDAAEVGGMGFGGSVHSSAFAK